MHNNIIIFSGPYPIDQLGATRTIDINLAKSLSEIGYNVTLIACGKCLIPNVNFVEIKQPANFSIFDRLISKLGFKKYPQIKRNRKVDRWVSNYLKEKNDIISNKTIFIGRAAMSLNSLIVAKKQGAHTILHSSWMHPLTQNNILEKEYEKLGVKTKPILKKRIKIQLDEIEIVDKIWCISQLVYESFLNNGVSSSKLIYIPLGVDIEHYNIKNHSNISIKKSKEKFKILFVGTVNFEKGAHLLLEALKHSQLKNIDLIFNGTVVQEFKNLFEILKLDLLKKNIQVILDPGDPKENYLSASVFVLPSIHESFGLVVLEAMASGLPVIISDGVGAKDCVVDGKTGFIFESHNVEELKNKIEFFYFNKSEISIQGKNAAIHAQNYSWLNTALEFKNCINI